MKKDKPVIILVVPAIIAAGGALANKALKKSGAKKREKRQMALQIQGQKEMAEFNRKQQMKLWEDTNYKAQVEQMKKAGLNVGLMYEGGGQGGVTQAQAGNVDAPHGEEEGAWGEGMGLAIDALLKKAQIDNIEADTKVKEKDAGIKGQQEESEGIDLEVKKAIGAESYEREARGEMQAKNARNSKEARTIDAWMTEAFGTDEEKEGQRIVKDVAGGYDHDENRLIRRVQRAGLEQEIQALEKLKNELDLQEKEGKLKDDQHIINQIQKRLLEFEDSLRDLGLNNLTGTIINKLLHIIFSRK